jgi:hypothetical protein
LRPTPLDWGESERQKARSESDTASYASFDHRFVQGLSNEAIGMSARSFSAAMIVAASVVLSASAPAQESTAKGKAAGAFAAASESTRELRRSLLEERWNYSKNSRVAAAQEYAAIRASGEATAADDLLYGIVQFRQHDYEASAVALTAALAAMPDDRMTLKTRILTAVERDELEVVWPLLSRLQRVVFARAKDPAIPTGTQREDLVFLGQLHGYLVGPYGELESERLLLSLRDEVAAGLPLTALRVFEEAERSVEERYEKLAGERKKIAARVEEELKAAAEAKRAELSERREEIEQERAKIDPALEKTADQSRETLGVLTEAEALAATSVQIAARQAENLRTEYRIALTAYLLQEDIAQNAITRAEELREQNPNRPILMPFGVFENLTVLRANLRRIEDQMVALQGNYAQLNFNFEQIRQRRVSEEVEMQRNMAKLNWDAAAIERELVRLDQLGEKVGDVKRSPSLALRTAERDLVSPSAYLDFSLETPRDAALAALKGP